MKNFKNDQSGRSMVEMLGVLAIIGVLSVGGIQGYSKAMAKYKVSKALDQISTIVANTRTLFATKSDFTDLTTAKAIGLGLFPDDMITGTGDTAKPINPFNGEVELAASAALNGAEANKSFILTYKGLDSATCAAIATADWGTGSSSGLIGISLKENTWILQSTTPKVLPISPVTAAEACKNGNVTIQWQYF